jgi:Nitroreductase family
MTGRSKRGAVPMARQPEQLLSFLAQCGSLAPSPGNSQPWRFELDDRTVLVHADYQAWRRTADPERRELFISLGCAIENVLIAAENLGFAQAVTYLPKAAPGDLVARVVLTEGGRASPDRSGISLESLKARRTHRGAFLPRHVTPRALRPIRAAHREPDLGLEFFGRRRVDTVASASAEAAAQLVSDPSYRTELAHSIGRGARGTSKATAWLEGLAVRHLHAGSILAKHDLRLLRGAPLIGVISSEADDHLTHLRVGQLAQRMWLHATHQGLAVRPLTQALTVPALRDHLARQLPTQKPFPQFLWAMGYPVSRKATKTPRLSIDELLV